MYTTTHPLALLFNVHMCRATCCVPPDIVAMLLSHDSLSRTYSTISSSDFLEGQSVKPDKLCNAYNPETLVTRSQQSNFSSFQVKSANDCQFLRDLPSGQRRTTTAQDNHCSVSNNQHFLRFATQASHNSAAWTGSCYIISVMLHL